jgi:hypothetical protein
MTRENEDQIDVLERAKNNGVTVVSKGSFYDFTLTMKPKIKVNE